MDPVRGGGKEASGADFMKRLDKDRDGKVSAREFEGLAEHFAQLDKNGDGFITEAEAAAGTPSGGGRRY